MVHLRAEDAVKPACGAGARWKSTQITTTTNLDKVTCLGCKRTMRYLNLLRSE